MNSYPKIHNVGHPSLDWFFDEPVEVEEKVDGSQFSFSVDIDGGELHFRSKRATIYPEAAGMFEAGVRAITEIKDRLVPGWVYRGEYLAKPKHNCLAYERVPRRHVILFDVMMAPERYMPRVQLWNHATDLGMDCVPLLYEGLVTSPQAVQHLLSLQSVLGGEIEGLVFKRRNNPKFGRDDKPLIAKHVRERFREVQNSKAFKVPKQEIIEAVIDRYRTAARWEKAVQHLRDDGILLGEPKDIGALIKESQRDLQEECADEIKQILYDSFIKRILRGSVRGLPEWYKDKLLNAQFEEEE